HFSALTPPPPPTLFPYTTLFRSNLPAKPDTLLFNKVTIKNATQAVQMFGPAQAAVARAVVDSVSSGIIPRDKVDDHRTRDRRLRDRKSTRLNSSHVEISYAVFCL